MKAWIKGGLIGTGIGLILFSIHIFVDNITDILWVTHFPFVIYNFIFNYELIGSFGGPRFLSQLTFVSFIHLMIGLTLSLVVYFIIGAIIGWIIGKIKYKKTSSPISLN